MLKENKWKLLVSSILIMLPALVGLILWDRLPEQMAIHWTLGGSADGWGSRVLAVFAITFAPQIVGLFLKGNEEVQRIGTLALRLQCIFLPVFSFVCIANMMLQTMGLAGRATLLATARQGMFFIPAVLGLEKIFGLLGVQMAQPVADVLAFLMAVPFTLGVLRELKEKEAQQNVQ